jgi:hypothetical protein
VSVRRFKFRKFKNGAIVVYDVPVFVECMKKGLRFDGAWIADAVRYHQQAEKISSFGAMHINHNGEAGIAVEPAGAWTNTRVGKVRTKDGRFVNGVLADLVFTDESAWRRVMRHQLLWRSPEIPYAAAARQSAPRLGSLALLDRHPPHNDDLPVLLLGDAEGVANEKSTPGAIPWVRENSPAVVASAETEDAILFLLELEAMPAKRRKKDTDTAPEDIFEQREDVQFQDDDEKKDDDAPPKDDGGSDDAPKGDSGDSGGDSKPSGDGGWKSKVDALKDIKVTAEDIPAFLDALKAVMDAVSGEGDAGEDMDAPAEEPDEIMQELGEPPEPPEDQIPLRRDDEVLKLRADVEAMRKRERARDAQIAFDRALDEAEKTLDGKATREEILTFAAQFPDKPAAVRAYTEAISKKVPRADATFHESLDAAETPDVPAEVMKFQAQGTDAYEWAIGEHRLWKDAVAGRSTSLNLERWLEVRRPDNTFSRA